MSIQDYLSPDGKRAMEISGWKEHAARLGGDYPDFVLICLIREHLREWLAERNIFIDRPGTAWRASMVGGKTLSSAGWSFVCNWKSFASYDLALVAAVLAAKENA